MGILTPPHNRLIFKQLNTKDKDITGKSGNINPIEGRI
jgi:hypothetical protein